MDAPSHLLDPKLLAQLGRTTIRLRGAVDGTLTGIHRSPHHGSSVEFTEHKEYSPGDEVRHIDWRVYARTDRWTVKRYEDETNLRAFFVLDCSASMGYRGEAARATKLTYAAMMVAHLGYLLLRQQDAVGLVAVADEVRAWLPPRARSAHVLDLTQRLEELRPAGETALHEGLSRVAETGHKRGIVYVLSDLFTDVEPVFGVLKQLRSRRHAVTLFHVLDKDEIRFPFERLATFKAMESDARLLAEPRAIRGTYLRALEKYLERVRRECGESGIGYQQVDTSRPLEETLSTYLREAGLRAARGARGASAVR
jgi:uncharacterized protein (DUF58 family)